MAVDPITLAVVKGRLEEITDEMDLTLYRAAFCPVIAEGHDACHGLYAKDTGDTLIQGKSSLPIFVGSMMFAVKAVIARVKAGAARGETLEPGDMFIFNDPYDGGTHLQDIKLVRPFFYKGEHLFWLAGTGHWVDVGGNVPGGFNSQATDFMQEGFMVRPVKLCRRGEINPDIVDIFLTNTRVPHMCYGDLNAQINSMNLGEKRLTELMDKYGPETVMEVMATLRARAANMMRDHLRALPDGTYSWEDWLDNDGLDDKPLKIALDLTIAGAHMTLDFSRTAPPTRGPLNIAYSTAVACCYVALKHVFPDVPANAGCFDAVTFKIPDTTLLNVRPPRPVGGYLEVILKVIACVFGAMSRVAPERTYGAPFGTVNSLALGGLADGRQYVMFCYFGGGLGGSAESDGLNHGNNPISTATILPVEFLETQYPVLFTQWALRPDSGGPGLHRGGLGAVYGVQLLGDAAECSVLGDRALFAPFGVLGGAPGALGRLSFRLGGQEHVPPMRSKAIGVPMRRGDTLTLESPGGGGYGNPLQRPPELVARDVRRGYVSAEQAAAAYGVVLLPDGTVDVAATAARRAELQATDRTGERTGGM